MLAYHKKDSNIQEKICKTRLHQDSTVNGRLLKAGIYK